MSALGSDTIPGKQILTNIRRIGVKVVQTAEIKILTNLSFRENNFALFVGQMIYAV